MYQPFKVCQWLAICCILSPLTVSQPPVDSANLDSIIKEIFDIPSDSVDPNNPTPLDTSMIQTPQYPVTISPDTTQRPTPAVQTHYSEPQRPTSQTQLPSQYPSGSNQPTEIKPNVNPENEINVSVCKLMKCI